MNTLDLRDAVVELRERVESARATYGDRLADAADALLPPSIP